MVLVSANFSEKRPDFTLLLYFLIQVLLVIFLEAFVCYFLLWVDATSEVGERITPLWIIFFVDLHVCIYAQFLFFNFNNTDREGYVHHLKNSLLREYILPHTIYPFDLLKCGYTNITQGIYYSKESWPKNNLNILNSTLLIVQIKNNQNKFCLSTK